MDRAGRRWKRSDPSRTECCCSFSRTTNLQDRDVFIRFELQLLQKHASGYIGRAPDSTDPQALTLKLLRRANRFVDDQFVGQRVDETTYRNHTRAADRSISCGATGNIADRYRARNDSRDGRCRGRNKDQLGIETVLFID